jgi:uncharacterized protein YdhG (YjbR/CyaY superfamily)
MRYDASLNDVDTYIASFPEHVRLRLSRVREIILEVAPHARESISYGMPAYKLNGKPLVYFGGYENHLGFYATPAGHEAFVGELASYKKGKGSVQFPHEKPLPEQLIIRMVRFRYEQEAGRSGTKARK